MMLMINQETKQAARKPSLQYRGRMYMPRSGGGFAAPA